MSIVPQFDFDDLAGLEVEDVASRSMRVVPNENVPFVSQSLNSEQKPHAGALHYTSASLTGVRLQRQPEQENRLILRMTITGDFVVLIRNPKTGNLVPLIDPNKQPGLAARAKRLFTQAWNVVPETAANFRAMLVEAGYAAPPNGVVNNSDRSVTEWQLSAGRPRSLAVTGFDISMMEAREPETPGEVQNAVFEDFITARLRSWMFKEDTNFIDSITGRTLIVTRNTDEKGEPVARMVPVYGSTNYVELAGSRWDLHVFDRQ